MATGILIEFNNVDEKRYDRINEALGVQNNPPKGLLFHVAGPTNSGGWRVLDIWESKELFDQFFKQRLQAALNQVGVTQPPRHEVFPIYNVIAPQPTLLTNLTPAGTAGARR